MALSTAYADLEIRILGHQEAGYPVEITLNPGQYYKRGSLTSTLPTWEGTQQTGTRLFAWLFADPTLKEAWEYVRGQYPQRHIRLRLDADAPELHALPWESLRDPTGLDLAGANATPFSRFLAGEWVPGSAVLAHPLRMLVAIADPCDLRDYGLAAFDAEAEWAALQTATEGLDVQLTRLPSPCTLAALDAELRQGYHILHLIAHGKYNQRRNQAALYLANAANSVMPVTEADFALMLQRQLADTAAQNDASLRLVFLASCESATRDTADAFRGLAPKLVEAGIPAIVAMQDRISLTAARDFSRTFYLQLLQHGMVDLAGNQARAALLTAGSAEAATPVIFMRLPDGKLWETAQATARARCDFYRHIDLPSHYIARPDVLDAICTALLASTNAVALTSAVKVALHGMGGIGKTVLARALCENAEVQRVFADGILWATLGQTPDLTARLREWITVLGGVISENVLTLLQLKARLGELLRDRACLLMVDDVWRRTDVEPFLVGGPRCRLLFTTRDAEIAYALDATLHPVDVLPLEQAEALLVEWAQGALATALPDLLRQIVMRLGCLPLALKLAGAQLRTKDPARWLETFTADQLKARRMETLHDNLNQTLVLSLDDLDASSRKCYIALAIFREDEAIPSHVLVKLWGKLVGLDEDEAVDLLHDLAARALLQYDPAHGVTLHDMLRDFIKGELGEQGTLQTHRTLLNAYQQTVSQPQYQTTQLPDFSTSWHEIPDDGYLYAHLVYHLDMLADSDIDLAAKLKALFANDAWLHARVSGDNYLYDGYLADLYYVWRRAEAQVKAGNADMLAECVRCALIRTTVNSLADNYIPEMIARAVQVGLWSAARALSVAAKMSKPWQHTKTLILLLANESLNALQRYSAVQDGIAAARFIKDNRYRARALAALAPYMEGDLLAEGLLVAQTIKDKWSRVRILAALASQLKGNDRSMVLSEGLMTVRSIEDTQRRAKALAALIPHLVGDVQEAVLAEGLTTVRAIEDEGKRVWTLIALVPYLTGDLLMKELTMAHAIENERRRAWVLVAMIPHLEYEQLVIGKSMAWTIRDERQRERVLAALVRQLVNIPQAHSLLEVTLAEDLATAQAIHSTGHRARALAALIPYLEGNNQATAVVAGLEAAQATRNKGDRVRALAALIPWLDGQMRERILTQGIRTLRTIKDAQQLAKAMIVLLPQLTNDDLVVILEEGVAATRMIRYADDRDRTLKVLSPYLIGSLLEKELARVRTIDDAKYCVRTLARLAPYLMGDDQTAALLAGLSIAQIIEGEWVQVEALAALLPFLTGELLTAGLSAIQAIRDLRYQRWALAALKPHTEGVPNVAVLAESLSRARKIEDEERRGEILTALAPHLTGKLLVKGFTAVREIRNVKHRTKALAALVPHLAGHDRAVALAESLSAMRIIEDERWQVEVLMTIAPHLAGKSLTEGLAVMRKIRNVKYRAKALMSLLPHLMSNDRVVILAEGLATARATEDIHDRAEALATLLPCFSGTEAQVLRRELQMTILDALRIDEFQRREMVLQLLATRNIFNPDILGLTSDAIACIATAVIDICQQWEWL